MAKVLNWTAPDKIPELRKAGIERLVQAAEIVRMNAILKLQGELEEKYPEHGVYEKNPSFWTERHYREMIHTIRVVRKHESSERTVWIMAGNKKVWWAQQMEFGHGGWKGGARPFLRAALSKSTPQIRAIIEGGHGETKGFEGYEG
jgi:hypothetical protein